MNWFNTLTGLKKESVNAVHQNISVDGKWMTCSTNGNRFQCGEFTTPALDELRKSIGNDLQETNQPKRLKIREVVADVASLHQDPNNADAVFQVASQFNCLEMVNPSVIPEDGVGIYQNDFTQGPACSISAGAATIYRNYFVPLDDQVGQTRNRQVDCLSILGAFLGNDNQRLWEMTNGYCFPTKPGLTEINDRLSELTTRQRDEICGKLQVGVQKETQVTLDGCKHLVTQVFCSALPAAYSRIPTSQFEIFAKFILDATYEATFLSAELNRRQTGCNKLFLTLIGGGVFGNSMNWILEAIERSVLRYQSFDLEVAIVSYGGSNSEVKSFVNRIQ